MASSDKELKKKFELLCNTAASKGKLSLEEIMKWCKQTEAIGKETGITGMDVEVGFSKLAKDEDGIEYSEFTEMLTELSREKNMDIEKLIEKLAGGAVGP